MPRRYARSFKEGGLMKSIDLSGSQKYRTDENDEGIVKGYFNELFTTDGFILPGSTCDNKIGKKQEYYDELSQAYSGYLYIPKHRHSSGRMSVFRQFRCASGRPQQVRVSASLLRLVRPTKNLALSITVITFRMFSCRTDSTWSLQQEKCTQSIAIREVQ